MLFDDPKDIAAQVQTGLRNYESEKKNQEGLGGLGILAMIGALVLLVITLVYLLFWVGVWAGGVWLFFQVYARRTKHARRTVWMVGLLTLLPLTWYCLAQTRRNYGKFKEHAYGELTPETRAFRNLAAGKALDSANRIMAANLTAARPLKRQHWSVDAPGLHEQATAGLSAEEKMAVSPAWLYETAFADVATKYGLPRPTPMEAMQTPFQVSVQRGWERTETALQGWAIARFIQLLNFEERPSQDSIDAAFVRVREELQALGFDTVEFGGSNGITSWLKACVPYSGYHNYSTYLQEAPQKKERDVIALYLVSRARSGALPTWEKGLLSTRPFQLGVDGEKWFREGETRFSTDSVPNLRQALHKDVAREAAQRAASRPPPSADEVRTQLIENFRHDHRAKAIRARDPNRTIEGLIDEVLKPEGAAENPGKT